jgi:WD40 repeat protein
MPVPLLIAVSILSAADATALQPDAALRAPRTQMVQVLASADGKYVLAADSAGEIWVWDLPGRKLLRTIKSCGERFAFSSDGKFAVVGHAQKSKAVPGSFDSPPLMLIDLATGRARPFENLTEPVREVAVSADGKLALSVSVWKVVAVGPSEHLWSAREVCALRLWDTATGKLVRTIIDKNAARPALFSLDGKVIASVVGASDSIEAGVDIRDLDGGRVGSLPNTLPGWPHCMAVSPNMKWLVTGHHGVVRKWDLLTGKLQWTFFAEKIDGQHWPITSVAISPDGARIGVTAGSRLKGEVRVLDAATGQLPQKFRPISEVVGAVSFTHDGAHILGGSADGVRLWDAGTGAPAYELTKSKTPPS